MKGRPVSVAARIPHPALPSANWADCYELRVDGQGLTASEAARMLLGQLPLWVGTLMKMRDAVTGFVGLKPSTHHSPEKVEMIGIFPVVSRSDSQIVLGFDDRHLDFRIVVDVKSLGADRQLISSTTLVNRKILLGKVYIAVVTPFHKVIVASMLSSLGKRLAAAS